MVAFESLTKKQANIEAVKSKGYEYFRANVLDLCGRGVYGKKVDGKVVKPTEAEIKAKYEELTGLVVTKQVKESGNV